MAEVLARFSRRIRGGGTAFRAQACGAPLSDGRWAAWIEFIPLDGGLPLQSPRETIQPNFTDVQYWATGLTPVYLEGALWRAQHPRIQKRTETARPVFSALPPEAILDPLRIYCQKGEQLLRRQLGALSPGHLVNIIRVFGLSDEPTAVLGRLRAPALIGRIVAGCQRLRAVGLQADLAKSS